MTLPNSFVTALPAKGEENCGACAVSSGDRMNWSVFPEGDGYRLELAMFSRFDGAEYFRGSELYPCAASLFGAMSAAGALNDDYSPKYS